jgi:hypothetical protein
MSWWVVQSSAIESRLVGPPLDQWMVWWAWVQPMGVSQPGNTQPPSRTRRARCCAGVAVRTARPIWRISWAEVVTKVWMVGLQRSRQRLLSASLAVPARTSPRWPRIRRNQSREVSPPGGACDTTNGSAGLAGLAGLLFLSSLRPFVGTSRSFGVGAGPRPAAVPPAAGSSAGGSPAAAASAGGSPAAGTSAAVSPAAGTSAAGTSAAVPPAAGSSGGGSPTAGCWALRSAGLVVLVVAGMGAASMSRLMWVTGPPVDCSEEPRRNRSSNARARRTARVGTLRSGVRFVSRRAWRYNRSVWASTNCRISSAVDPVKVPFRSTRPSRVSDRNTLSSCSTAGSGPSVSNRAHTADSSRRHEPNRRPVTRPNSSSWRSTNAVSVRSLEARTSAAQ